MGPGEDDLGPLRDLLDVADEGPDPLSPLVGLLEDLLRNGDDPLGATQVDDDVAPSNRCTKPLANSPFFT